MSRTGSGAISTREPDPSGPDPSGPERDARALAENQAAAVRESPAGRAALMSRAYDGPFGRAPRHLPFRRAAGSFMAWQRRRGVPRFALGPLAPLGRVLGDPRLGAVGVFLSLRRVVPASYPPAWPLEDYLAKEGVLGQVLDHGVLRPRLAALYRWAADELSVPALETLIVDGVPSYAWSEPADHVVWSAPPPRSPAVRAARRVLRVEDATPGR